MVSGCDRFGGDPAAIGQQVQLDGDFVEIVGILPARAPIPGPQQLGDLVRLPPAIDVVPADGAFAEALRSPGDLNYGVIARVRPGVAARGAAVPELNALALTVSKQTGDDGRKRAVVVQLQQMVTRQARTPLTVLFATTCAVVLIVCVNLANLLLARHTGRRRDDAVRTALGAGRGSLVADSLIESLLLALGGGMLGIGIAWVVTRIIVAIAPAALSTLNRFEFDVGVCLFAVASSDHRRCRHWPSSSAPKRHRRAWRCAERQQLYRQLRGRTFLESDRGRQVDVLSASAAQALWPSQDPIGRFMKTSGYLGAVTEVIGVAADSRAVDLTRTNVLFTYLRTGCAGHPRPHSLSGASVPAETLAFSARRAIWEVNRNVAIPRTETWTISCVCRLPIAAFSCH